jgi:hypothetical protein
MRHQCQKNVRQEFEGGEGGKTTKNEVDSAQKNAEIFLGAVLGCVFLPMCARLKWSLETAPKRQPKGH